MSFQWDKAAFTPRMWWRFTLVFMPCLLLFLFLDAYVYQQEKQHYIALIEKNEHQKIEKLHADLLLEVAGLSRTLLFLSRYLEKQYMMNRATSSVMINAVMRDVAQSDQAIDYISFFPRTPQGGGHSCSTKDCKKHGRLRDSIPQLHKNELFISEIYLQRVKGKVQVPLKAVMTLALGVFAESGYPLGVLVLNHRNKELFNALDWVNKDSKSQIMLLNEDAYWLYHPEKKYEWGAEFRERRHLRLSNQNAQLWQYMNREGSGQLYDHEHLYTFQKLYPRQQINLPSVLSVYKQADQPLVWLLVARYPHHVIQSLLDKTSYFHIPVLLLLFLMLALLLWSYVVACLQRTKNKLADHAHRLAQTQALSYMGSWSLTMQRLQCSERAYQILGVDVYTSSISFKTFLSLVHPDDRKEVKLQFLESMNDRKDYDMIHRIIRLDDAKIRTVHAKAYVNVDDQQQVQMTGVVQDISAQLHDKERIRFLAQQDVLTNVPNRSLFMDRLGQNILYSQREQSRFAILYISLNHFRKINQRIGHHKADLILRELAQRLAHAVRRSDTVARISDHVFAILLRHTFEHDDLQRVCNNLRAILHAPIFIQQGKYDIQVSMGIVCFPEDGTNVEILNIRASQAVDIAREKKHDVFYTEISTVEIELFTKHNDEHANEA